MANTTTSSHKSSPSDRESSHVQKSTSSRASPRTTTRAPATSKADAPKNTNGKRPIDDDETSEPRKQPKSAAANKHVAGNKKSATKSTNAPAASRIPAANKNRAATKATSMTPSDASKTPAAATKIPAANKATTASKTLAANKPAPATTNGKPRANAPAPGSRFKLTAKEDIIRPAKRSYEQLVREKKEEQERYAEADRKAKNFQVHPALLEGKKKSAFKTQTTKTGATQSQGATKAEAPAEKTKRTIRTIKAGPNAAMMARSKNTAKALAEKTTTTTKVAPSAGKTNNTAKALAEKTTNTSTKRRVADAELDDFPSPQKKRRAETSQPARLAGKKTVRKENAPAEAKAKPARPTEATKKAEEKPEPAPKPARKVKKELPRVLWDESSDGEEFELELVTKEEVLGQDWEDRGEQGEDRGSHWFGHQDHR